MLGDPCGECVLWIYALWSRYPRFQERMLSAGKMPLKLKLKPPRIILVSSWQWTESTESHDLEEVKPLLQNRVREEDVYHWASPDTLMPSFNWAPPPSTNNDELTQGLRHLKDENLCHPTRQASPHPRPHRNTEGVKRSLERVMVERHDEYQLLPWDQP